MLAMTIGRGCKDFFVKMDFFTLDLGMDVWYCEMK